MGLGVVFLQFGDVGQQFLFAGQAAEVEADHLVGPQRRLAARPEADQQAGDDRAVGLNLDAVLSWLNRWRQPRTCLKNRKKISIVQR